MNTEFSEVSGSSDKMDGKATKQGNSGRAGGKDKGYLTVQTIHKGLYTSSSRGQFMDMESVCFKSQTVTCPKMGPSV